MTQTAGTRRPTAPRRRRPDGSTIAILTVIGLTMVGSAAFIVWGLVNVQDDQIPLLAYGFVVLGASFGALAVASLVAMWRAASRSRAGRALLLAIIGGLSALAAIGCFTASALLALVWNS